MKGTVDLVIAGAIIKDISMIQKAIDSAPKYEYEQKWIVFDGCPDKWNKSLKYQEYQAYKKYISNKYPEFIITEETSNIYFREMMAHICDLSAADNLLVIQDDVVLHELNLVDLMRQAASQEDMKILCFPHREIPPEGTHWFSPFDDTWPLPFIKSHGWSERVFLCSRVHIQNMINTSPKKSRQKLFIEAIYHTKMLSTSWKRMSDEEKEIYWQKWGCYFHYDILHTHLVGKR